MLKKVFGLTFTLAKSYRVPKKISFIGGVAGYNFSKFKVHHTIKRIQSELDANNIDVVLQEVGELQIKDRQKCLRMIFKAIQSNKLPSLSLQNKNFADQIQKFPQIFIDVNLYHIRILRNYLDELIYKDDGESEEVIVTTLNEINDAFAACKRQLQKIEKGQKSIKYELLLGKYYTNFYLFHSFRFIKGKQREQGLKKCCETLRRIMALQKSMLRQELTRIDELQKRELQSDESEKTKFEIIDENKQHMLKLVDLFTENVLHLYQAICQLSRYHQNQGELNQGLKEAKENIEASIQFYDYIKNVSFYSKYYLQLKKVKAEIAYSLAVSSLKASPEKDGKQSELKLRFCKQLDEIYKDARKCLQLFDVDQDNSHSIRNIAIILLGLRFEQLQRQQKLNFDEIKNNIMQESTEILGSIKNPQIRQAIARQHQVYSNQLLESIREAMEQKEKDGGMKNK